MQSERITVRAVASLLGLFTSSLSAIELGALHYRSLERDKVLALQGDTDYNLYMTLSQAGLDDVCWWIDNCRVHNGTRVRKPKVDMLMYTDSSKPGWGASCNGCQAAGRWSCVEAQRHINELEFVAVLFALKSLIHRDDSRRHVKVVSDSMTTVTYINHIGGRKPKLHVITCDIYDFASSKQLYVSAGFICGRDNVLADKLSRALNDSTEWMLDKAVFANICKSMFVPDYRPVCLQTKLSASPICVLGARPRLFSSGCFHMFMGII